MCLDPCGWDQSIGGNVVQVRVSPEVGILLDEAVAVSVQRGSKYVGVEHLFEAVVSQPRDFSQVLTDADWSCLHQAVERAYRDAWRGKLPPIGGDIFYTPRCAAITHEAAHLAARLRSGSTTAAHVLLAILADAHSAPSRALDRAGRTRNHLIAVLRETLKGPGMQRATPKPQNGSRTEKAQPQPARGIEKEKAVSLSDFTRDLTQLAREGLIEPAIGRDSELLLIAEILARKGKHNVMLVGEPGTGKTKIIEGLACKLAEGAFDGVIQQTRILELNISAMMSGTQYRGSFEEKVFAMLEELHHSDDTILFIDEVHLIMGAGATGDDSMDLGNLLKPALGRGELRCIGATTLKEYRKFIAKDPALERRFQMARVEPLSPGGTLEVLRALKPSLEEHHGVHIKRAALEASVRLTERYLPNRFLPDKAIDVLDQACARHRIGALMERKSSAKGGARATELTVTTHNVRQVVSQVAAVPIEEITHEERQRLADLDARLSEKIVGQERAIAKVVSAVKKSRAGLADPNRPDAVMLFLGPTGVGKTQLAKELSRNLFGSSKHLITFDMSAYTEAHSVSRLIGAPPGYAGYGEEGLLTAAVQNSPFSILLFDEIEKAHPKIFDLFLPMLDEGRLKDSDGREVSFRNCIIIFTSNVGADKVCRPADGEDGPQLVDELRKHFRPEFINRIDEIVPFYPLLFEDVRGILKNMVDALRLRLQEKYLGIRMYQRAYEFLAEVGYSETFGARELQRAVERHVANPLSEMILEGRFKPGDMIDVLMEDGVLTYRKGKPSRKRMHV